MKHTKGEWKVRFLGEAEDADFFVEAPNPSQPYGIEILGDDYGDHCGYPREQRLADAILIAQAPSMLQTLKEVRSQLLDGEHFKINSPLIVGIDKDIKAAS